MNVYKILYYTNNLIKYEDFGSVCKDGLSNAFNTGAQVVLLNSFYANNQPIFSSLRELRAYLDELEESLSNLIIVMDCELLKEDSHKALQTLLIEFLEIKFIFDIDPRWVIFNQNEIKEIIRNAPVEICEQSLNVLEHCTERGVVTQHFKKLMSIAVPNDREYWILLRELFKGCEDQNFEDRVRNIRKQLIRRIALQNVHFDFLILPKEERNYILDLIHTQDNLFDASNLRYCIKQWKYAELDVHSRNFSLIQNSRRDNLAICVEEEHGQNRFNSYCLFACGFRVLPVTSATGLLRVNETANLLTPSLIIRDYDLQFCDSTAVVYDANGGSNGSIKAIRGFRDDFNGNWVTHVKKSPCWSAFYDEFEENTTESGLDLGIPHLINASICFSSRVLFPVYFVSKGTWNVSINVPVSFIFEINDGQNDKKTIQCSHYIKNIKGVNTLCVPGLLKPVSGIYEPFKCIPKVRNRLIAIKTPPSDYIDTSREGHAHGTSLDIYNTVISLIRRAERYYNRHKYILAAILSNEAIEYLNGFHEALLLKAYQILAISENAIAMDSLGGDEEALKKDTLFRINKIGDEIDRILRRKKKGSSRNEDRREFEYNILNQIYSSCRNFCQEKEHFLAEDCFISAMAHVNEGFTPCDIKDEILAIRQKIHKSWIAKKNETKFEDYE